MKMHKMTKILAVALAGAFACAAGKAHAQGAAPQMSSGVAQILQLEQAKIGDDTIIGFIQNSGNSFPLDAGQIIYLRQQGVSEAVISAMLKQPNTAVAVAGAPAPQLASTVTTAVAAPVVAVQPAATYVQTVPVPYYYPAYGCYWRPRPLIGIGFGCHGWGVGIRL